MSKWSTLPTGVRRCRPRRLTDAAAGDSIAASRRRHFRDVLYSFIDFSNADDNFNIHFEY
jgi:hypothetical protein